MPRPPDRMPSTDSRPIPALSRTLTGAAIFASAPELLGTVGVDPRVALPPGGVVAPDERCLNRRSRQRCALQDVERVPDDAALHLRIPGFAAGIPEREVAEQEPRNAALLDDVARRAHHHGRDAVLFQVPRDQTHGLVTHRSEWNEKRHIDTIFAAAPQNLGRVVLERAALAVIGRHAVKARRQLADPSLRSERLQGREGQE